MATITVQIRKGHGGTVDLIPARILKAMPQDELLDRLGHAADLATRTRDPDLAAAYGLISKAMLAAPPRETVAREIARRYLVAGRTPDPVRAEALRRDAIRLIERHPPAPTRAEIAKARATKAKAKGDAGMVAVFDAAGKLVGIADPGDIVQVQAADAPGDAKDGGKPPADPAPEAPAAAPAAPAAPVPAATAAADMPPASSGEVGTPTDDVAKSAQVLKAAFRSQSPAEQNAAAIEMQRQANAKLSAIHARGRSQRGRR